VVEAFDRSARTRRRWPRCGTRWPAPPAT